MERENNMRDFKIAEDDIPKFGAGSEYNRDQKEEARRKKFGIIAKKYNPENQPWILKVGSGSKTGKKFRGIREGGVSENAAHFVFTQTKDGSIEAFPLNEWYNFQPIQRYKALTAEEAEEEFGRRKKCVNRWTMQMRLKLKNKVSFYLLKQSILVLTRSKFFRVTKKKLNWILKKQKQLRAQKVERRRNFRSAKWMSGWRAMTWIRRRTKATRRRRMKTMIVIMMQNRSRRKLRAKL